MNRRGALAILLVLVGLFFGELVHKILSLFVGTHNQSAQCDLDAGDIEEAIKAADDDTIMHKAGKAPRFENLTYPIEALKSASSNFNRESALAICRPANHLLRQ